LDDMVGGLRRRRDLPARSVPPRRRLTVLKMPTQNISGSTEGAGDGDVRAFRKATPARHTDMCSGPGIDWPEGGHGHDAFLQGTAAVGVPGNRPSAPRRILPEPVV